MISSKFYRKLWQDILPVKGMNWFQSWYYYVIDSKMKTKKRLDKFVLDPLKSPQDALVNYGLKHIWDGSNESKIVIKNLKYVDSRVRYATDLSTHGRLEYWADPYETWLAREDDCDGKNALIYHLTRLCQVPSYMIWNVIGYVVDDNSGTGLTGHYWLLYLDTDTQALYSIDSTYNKDFSEILYRKPFKLGDNGYWNIWYIWNEDMILTLR